MQWSLSCVICGSAPGWEQQIKLSKVSIFHPSVFSIFWEGCVGAGHNIHWLTLRGAMRAKTHRPVLTVKRFQETCAATRHATNLPRRSVERGNCPILCVKITLSVTISLNQDKNRNSISEQAHLPGHKNHMSDPIPEIQAAYNGKKRAALS